MQLLDQYFNTPFYGCRKLTFWLKDLGFKVNRKRVRRLMQIINWQTIYRNLKQQWVIKNIRNTLIYSKIWRLAKKSGVGNRYHLYSYGKRVYLTAIIDLHTRFVLNWFKQHNECRLCRYFARNYTKVWCAWNFNTDQGSQYTSEVHTNVLLNNGIKISMDGKGRAIDNIFIERLWRTVKYENVYLQALTESALQRT
jgi:putative transposase